MSRRKAKTENISEEITAPKSWWQELLESAGGAALVATLIGGIFASIVSAIIQHGAKEREFQQSWLKAQGEQSLAAYKDYLDQEREAVARAYSLIGDSISSAQNLLIFSTPDFAPGTSPEVDRERAELKKNWDAVDARWRSEKINIGLMMSYYHKGSPDVMNAWNKIDGSVTAYMVCARNQYKKAQETPAKKEELEKEPCSDKANNYQGALQELSVALEKNRRYAWEGWESPEKMRASLDRENVTSADEVDRQGKDKR